MIAATITGTRTMHRTAILAALALTLAACNPPDRQAAAPATPAAPEVVIDLAASTMFDSYQDNEVASDGVYKGARIQVTGDVARIESDVTDEAVVDLAAGNEFQVVQAHGLAKDVAATLHKGQRVTLLCTGAGEVVGTPMVDACTMVR
jgi:hypothetical protein